MFYDVHVHMDHFVPFLALGLRLRPSFDRRDKVVHVKQLPLRSQIEADVDSAAVACRKAAEARRRWRRRVARTYQDRVDSIAARIETLSNHSDVLRSHARFAQAHPQLYAREQPILRLALEDLRRERRKLTKML